MRISDLAGMLEAELNARGDAEVLVAVQPGYGLIMPGQPVKLVRGEGGALAVLSSEVDLPDWIAELDGIVG